MIDNLSILLSHGLILLMFWLLIPRDDLDREDPPEPDKDAAGFAQKKPSASMKARNGGLGGGTPDA